MRRPKSHDAPKAQSHTGYPGPLPRPAVRPHPRCYGRFTTRQRHPRWASFASLRGLSVQSPQATVSPLFNQTFRQAASRFPGHRPCPSNCAKGLLSLPCRGPQPCAPSRRSLPPTTNGPPCLHLVWLRCRALTVQDQAQDVLPSRITAGPGQASCRRRRLRETCGRGGWRGRETGHSRSRTCLRVGACSPNRSPSEDDRFRGRVALVA